VWIPELGKDNAVWNVISGNHAILNHPVQRILLAEAKLNFFFPDKYYAALSAFDQGRKLIWLWPEIKRFAGTSEPAVYEIQTGPTDRNLRIKPVMHGKKALRDLRDRT
jgi:hypothetical protein